MSRFEGGVLGVAAVGLLTIGLGARAADVPAPTVSYPESFRDFVHVKSTVVGPEAKSFPAQGGLHHFYANEAALKGHQGGTFPDGAVLIDDLLEATTKDGITTSGPRRHTAVMVRDAAKFAATGGWGFEGFAGDSKTERAVGANAATACFACHQARKPNDYVFSSYRP